MPKRITVSNTIIHYHLTITSNKQSCMKKSYWLCTLTFALLFVRTNGQNKVWPRQVKTHFATILVECDTSTHLSNTHVSGGQHFRVIPEKTLHHEL
jgi:hypothetical protein